jgi:uncharacterized protein (DUF1330 family)
MSLDPTAAQLAALAADAETGPVVMLNLMRFRQRSADGDGSGWDAYLRYSRGVMPLIKARGGTIVWAGNATGVAIGAAADGVDYVALVQYPSRRDFVEMMRSADYAAVNRHRLNGCARHVILAVSPTYAKLAAS